MKGIGLFIIEIIKFKYVLRFRRVIGVVWIKKVVNWDLRYLIIYIKFEFFFILFLFNLGRFNSMFSKY